MKTRIHGSKWIVVALTLLFAVVAGGTAIAEERIQLAILLDTSNSMDGLISQAKTQLWKIVNELARSRRHGVHPALEVALFEYGNDNLESSDGYIRMVTNLTTDLDKISAELFKLDTNGGSEYCGTVIDRAVDQLSWSRSNDVLKVIYIAGNEPFTQGNVSYKSSTTKAIRKGVVVNTIFCGSFDEGIATSWKDGADRADGRYMSINQDEEVVVITTPFDKDIVRLGDELNGTYVGYGTKGEELKSRQAEQDSNAATMGAGAPVERSVAKAQAAYSNSGWDLVDAVQNKAVKIGSLKDDELPVEMRKMSLPEKEKYVQGLVAKRVDIQKKINDANEKRRVYIAQQMKSQAKTNSLDEAILTSVRDQATKKGFTIE